MVSIQHLYNSRKMSTMKLQQENDVIFGGRKVFQSHPGTVRYQKMIDSNIDTYGSATKHKRSSIISNILNKIQNSTPAGVFLQENVLTGKLEALSDHQIVRHLHYLALNLMAVFV
jgi:hypothetical protein